MKHERKKMRLNNYNYSKNGYYFVTICIKDKQEYFGEIEDNLMKLNDYGKIAKKYWIEIPKHFKNIQLHDFVIMPDHIHGIIEIYDHYNNCINNELLSINEYLINNSKLLPKIISQYKSSVSRCIKKQYNDYNFLWQRSYYDVIIHSETKFEIIRKYIIENPLKWSDKQYL